MPRLNVTAPEPEAPVARPKEPPPLRPEKNSLTREGQPDERGQNAQFRHLYEIVTGTGGQLTSPPPPHLLP